MGRLSLLKQNQHPVAIDFGVSALKVLQVTPGEPPSLVAAAMLETPEDLLFDHAKRLKFQMEALPRLIKTGGFRGKRAVCSIPACHSFYCKHMEFQKAEGVSTAALVRAALPTQLRCEADALVYRHIEVGKVERPGSANRSEVICMATGRGTVERLMGAIKASKLEPVGMHSEFEAALRSMPGDGEKPMLLLDLGTATTKVVIAHGERIVFARAIEIGGRHLDETVAHQLKLTMGQAHRHRLEMEQVPRRLGAAVPAGVGGDHGHTMPSRPARPEPDLTETLEILTDEIQMCLRYHASLFPSSPVDRAVFVGGETTHRALCEHVARVLRMPAQTADPLARMGRSGKEPMSGVDMTEPQPGWAVALGLCLSPTDL